VGWKTLEAKLKLQKLGLPAPEDTRIQHIQQMQSCALFWVKDDMTKAYMRAWHLTIVLARGARCDWLNDGLKLNRCSTVRP